MFGYFVERTMEHDGKSANRKKKTTQKTNGSVEEEWDRRDTYIVPKCIPLIKVGFYHDVIGWRAVSASRRHLLKGGEHLNTRDVTASSPRTEPPRPAAPRLHTLTHTRLSRDGFLVCLFFCVFLFFFHFVFFFSDVMDETPTFHDHRASLFHNNTCLQCRYRHYYYSSWCALEMNRSDSS